MKALKSILLLIMLDFALFAGGWLVVIGGGKKPPEVLHKIIQRAGGVDQIVIIPAASEDQLDSALYARHDFEANGARNVRYVILEAGQVDTEENLLLIKKSSAVFFSGGDQNRLIAILSRTKLLAEIKKVYARSGVIAGTSAGAAVVSKIMITGKELLSEKKNSDEKSGSEVLKTGNVQTAEGFGFLRNVIIDQHFIKRKRFNRLLSLVLENPGLLGIGIDEETAIIVQDGRSFEVSGSGQVLIIDARKSLIHQPDINKNLRARNVLLHLLGSGEKFDLQRGHVL